MARKYLELTECQVLAATKEEELDVYLRSTYHCPRLRPMLCVLCYVLGCDVANVSIQDYVPICEEWHAVHSVEGYF